MHNKPIYEWIPGKGISLEAIERMRNHFRKPQRAMGEAWFNTKERRIYTELVDQPFENIKNSDLCIDILFEISSGTKSFGHRDEWDEWFKFLLPSVILRCNDFLYFKSMVAPHVISAFMSVYWTGIVEEYEGFRNDVMNSLSIWLMNRELWFDFSQAGRTFPRTHVLDKYEDGAGNLRLDWHAGHSDENLSASMFFCLKYLYSDEIPSWVKSLFAFEDPYWKGALVIWLLGSYDLLNDPVAVPSRVEKSKPDVSWDESHCLGSTYGSIDAKYPPSHEYNDNRDFLPPDNTKVFLEEIRKYVTVDLIYEWSELFEKHAFVRESTHRVPDDLLEKFT